MQILTVSGKNGKKRVALWNAAGRVNYCQLLRNRERNMGIKRSQFGQQLLRLAAFIGCILVCSSAYASGNDIDLTRLVSVEAGSPVTDDAGFKALARAYGSAFAPLPMTPASTIIT